MNITTPTDFTFTPNSNFNTYFKDIVATSKLLLGHIGILLITCTSKTTLSTSETKIGSLTGNFAHCAGVFVNREDTSVAGGCLISNGDLYIHPSSAASSNKRFIITCVTYKT